jgi:hypothetical protein
MDDAVAVNPLRVDNFGTNLALIGKRKITNP